MRCLRVLASLACVLVLSGGLASAQILAQNTIQANGETVTIPPGPRAGVLLSLTGTFVGTLAFEALLNSQAWTAFTVETVSSGARVTGATATGVFLFPNTGALSYRVRATAWTSGTVLVVGVSGAVAVLTQPISGTVTTTGLTDAELRATAVPVSGSGTFTVAGTITNTQATVTTATVATVASSATNVTLQASNASRKGWAVYNDSTQVLYVKFGATATTSSFTVYIPSTGYYEMPSPTIYTGVIDGLWASANGNARVTEW